MRAKGCEPPPIDGGAAAAPLGGFALVAYVFPTPVVKRALYTFEPEAGQPTVRLGRVALVLGFVAGTARLVTHAIGANTFIIVRIMEPFWFFEGIVTMLPMLQPGDGPRAPRQKRREEPDGL